MPESAKQLYEAGRLNDAIVALGAEIKAHPSDSNKRGFLAELLAFDGNLARCDLQLDVMSDQDPGAALGVALFRQIVRGEKARQEFFADGRVPEFVDGVAADYQAYLEASMLLRDKDAAGAAALLDAAEAKRRPVTGRLNGAPFDGMRDLDDLLAPFFEVITSTGKYYLIPISTVLSIEFRKPERPRDLVWRRALMSVVDGPDGEVFLPAIYHHGASAPDELIKLGRATEWLGGDGAPVRGRGQRTYLIGEEAAPILQIDTLDFDRG